jgi:hypothetical protein
MRTISKGRYHYEMVLYQPPNAHVQISWDFATQRNGHRGRELDR